MNRNISILLIVVAFAAGATSVYFFAPIRQQTPVPASTSTERKVLYWHDPMVPGPRFDKPGKSPFMDMDLVPVYGEEAGATEGPPIVTVRPEIVNNLGVRIYKLERSRLARRTTTHGYLMPVEGNGAYTAQVDIFDRDADWVREGMVARLRIDALPGETFSGSVASIDPDIGIGARTLKAQVRVATRDPRLKPNMFAEVTIEAPSATAHLHVPREAVIRTGTRTAVVRALGEGRFQPVDVFIGRELGEFIEIRQGLKEGDSVVVSGQFLIDSEASLRATFTRLTPSVPTKDSGAPTTAPKVDAHKH